MFRAHFGQSALNGVIMRPHHLVVRRSSRFQRQADHDHGAGAERRADAHAAAVHFDERLGDGEAKARSLVPLGQLAFDLLEWPAELAQCVFGNADAGVLDGDGDHAAAHAALTVTAPPSGVNFTALERRLSAICLSARRSALRWMPGAM